MRPSSRPNAGHNHQNNYPPSTSSLPVLGNATQGLDGHDSFRTFPVNPEKNPYSSQPTPNFQQFTHDSKEIERPAANYFCASLDPEFRNVRLNVYALHRTATDSLLMNGIFLVQLLEFALSFSVLVISALVITQAIFINHYWFNIFVLIIGFVLVIIHSVSVIFWQKQSHFSHTHNNEIFISFFFWLISTSLSSILLGIWLKQKKNGECCSFAASQPEPFPLSFNNEFTQLMVLYGIILSVHSISMYITHRALIAHYYPEKRFTPACIFPSKKTEYSEGETERISPL